MRLRTLAAVVVLLAIATPAIAGGIRFRVIRRTPHEAPAQVQAAPVARTAPVSVPEPSTMLLTALGMGALGLLRRR
jgi:hypothetical protein